MKTLAITVFCLLSGLSVAHAGGGGGQGASSLWNCGGQTFLKDTQMHWLRIFERGHLQGEVLEMKWRNDQSRALDVFKGNQHVGTVQALLSPQGKYSKIIATLDFFDAPLVCTYTQDAD